VQNIKTPIHFRTVTLFTDLMTKFLTEFIGVGDGGQGGARAPLKFGKNIFSGNLLLIYYLLLNVKFGHFLAKIM